MKIYTDRTGNPRFPISLFLFVLLSVVSSTVFAQPVGLEIDKEEIGLEFKLDGVESPYIIARNLVGIIVNRDMGIEKVNDLTSSLGGKVVQSFDSGIHIVKLTERKERKALNSLSANMRSKSGIDQAGIVVYPAGYETPLIATNQLVVEFKPGVTEAMVRLFAHDLGLATLMQDLRQKQLWLFSIEGSNHADVLSASADANKHRHVKHSLPNFTVHTVLHQFSTNDPLFNDQWHHLNTGQSGGTYDADVDSELAWSFTEGDDEVVIAIIDAGFDIDHEDLEENLWRNTGENGVDSNGNSNEPNGIDDDGNDHVDDIHGYDYTDCFRHPSSLSPPDCGTGNISGAEHGTLVAGVAAARGHNDKGLFGACPRCSLMLIQQRNSYNHYGYLFGLRYAVDMGADIISNSWGYSAGSGVPWYLEQEVEDTVDSGMIVFWSLDNKHENRCAGTDSEFAAIDGVIGVSASSNWDRKVTESGFGDCVQLLAPSHKGFGPDPKEGQDTPSVEYTGSLNIATTDRPDSPGYNDANNPNDHPSTDSDFCISETQHLNYTLCFGGTSASTPVVAGIGGLVLSANDSLNLGPLQMERLLQDTADKIEPGLANFSGITGISNDNATPTHGYGRVNAYEAVRIVASRESGSNPGLGGTDIFLRDNELDWGNTAQEVYGGPAWRGGSNVKMNKDRGTIAHYRSVDIKVDVENSQSAPTSSIEFDDLDHMNPVSMANNQVYVRVHNRGPETASDVEVKLFWVRAGTALPMFPSNFWSPNATSFSPWNLIGTQTINSLGYSGASVAGTQEDVSVILKFEFLGPVLDTSRPAFRHHCLLAVIDSPDDRVNETRLVPDVVTPTNNNVTHRNVAVQNASAGTTSSGLMVRNPFPHPIMTRLVLINPDDWEISLSDYRDEQVFELGPGKEVPVLVKITPPHSDAKGDVEIRQEVMEEDEFYPIGGFIYQY